MRNRHGLTFEAVAEAVACHTSVCHAALTILSTQSCHQLVSAVIAGKGSSSRCGWSVSL